MNQNSKPSVVASRTYLCSGRCLFSLGRTAPTFRSGTATLYGARKLQSPRGVDTASDSDRSLRKATRAVDTNSTPAMGPAVVHRWHCDARSSFSSLSAENHCRNSFSTLPPARRIFAPSESFPFTVSESFGPRVTARDAMRTNRSKHQLQFSLKACFCLGFGGSVSFFFLFRIQKFNQRSCLPCSLMPRTILSPFLVAC
uniref:Uncharacterized protein n=1 Tax=Zea mays TaxID=4577 RepID=A0A804NTR0_MAIZE